MKIIVCQSKQQILDVNEEYLDKGWKIIFCIPRSDGDIIFVVEKTENTLLDE